MVNQEFERPNLRAVEKVAVGRVVGSELTRLLKSSCKEITKKKIERELNLALGKKRSLWYKGLTGHNPIREEVVNGGYRRQGR